MQEKKKEKMKPTRQNLRVKLGGKKKGPSRKLSTSKNHERKSFDEKTI